MCRRKYLLHYFGEEFIEDTCDDMCDNCKHPKPKFEGKEFVHKLLQTMISCNESFKSKETVKVLVGESNSLIKQHQSIINNVFACGKGKSKEFWHAVIRQIIVSGLVDKDIESYGIIKLNNNSKEFI